MSTNNTKLQSTSLSISHSFDSTQVPSKQHSIASTTDIFKQQQSHHIIQQYTQQPTGKL